jgi:DNA-damage-inducible protein D
MTDSLLPSPHHESPFQRIRRVNSAGNEFWSSRDFAEILGYTDYRNFEQVIQKARTACFNSGQRVDDHFVDVTEMIRLGSGTDPHFRAGAIRMQQNLRMPSTYPDPSY